MMHVFCKVGLFLLTMISLSAGEKRSFQVLPSLAVAPTLDGHIEEEEWKGALLLDAFRTDSGPAAIPTQAMLAIDDVYLYLAVRCHEPEPERIVRQVIADEKDGAIWRDDSIELFLDPGNSGKILNHFMINSEGTSYEAMIVGGQSNPAGWNPEAIVRTRIGTDLWEAEIAIPLTSLGMLLAKGDLVRLNLARNRHAAQGDAPEISSLSGGNISDPEQFIKSLIKGPIQLPHGTLISTRRGPFLQGHGGEWEFLVQTEKPMEVQLRFPESHRTPVLKRGLTVGQQTIKIPFEESESNQMQQCQIEVDGQQLAAWRATVLRPSPPERIATTEDPLFESLLEERPNGLSAKGFVLWNHLSLAPLNNNFERLALRTAIEATPETISQWYRKHGAIWMHKTSLYRSTIPTVVYQRDQLRDNGVGTIIHLHPIGALESGVPEGPSHQSPWLLDPRAQEAYLEDARFALEMRESYPGIRMFSAGDEVWEIMHRNLLHFLDNKEGYPELTAVDAEIKEHYGFGKFGLPHSSTDVNPFRWIATIRWEIDQMIALQKRVRNMAQKEGITMMSWNNISGHRPFGLHRWGEVFDIITGQLYPPINPHRQTFTFLTHLLADLSGVEEVWPCTHIEHYSANFTKEETEELLSQSLRGGATGLHLYLADTQASRRGHTNPVTDIIGAPERWAVVEALTQRMQNTPFRVQRPPADIGIFYSNTSYQGQGAGSGRALMYTNEVEWIYTLCGPKNQGAIRFIDETIASTRKHHLEGLKLIYLPYANIIDDAEYDTLETFVRNGGTLVICDPLAFSYRSDGSRRETGALVPLLISREAGQPVTVTTEDNTTLPAVGATFRLEPPNEAEILGTSPEGYPLIIKQALGKGNVITFATNPLSEGILSDDSWIRFFGFIQREAGAIPAKPYWRFRLPSLPASPSVDLPGVSLTKNHLRWSYSQPYPAHHALRGGSYRLNRSDVWGREDPEHNYPFGEGRLSDRLKGAKASTSQPAENHVLEWDEDAPVEVTYHFEGIIHPKEIHIFHNGPLPRGIVESSSNGIDWEACASWEMVPFRFGAGEGVAKRVIGLKPTQSRLYRLRFVPEKGHYPWLLAEIDWWGEELSH